MIEMTANVILLSLNLIFSWKAASFFLLLKKISIVMSHIQLVNANTLGKK